MKKAAIVLGLLLMLGLIRIYSGEAWDGIRSVVAPTDAGKSKESTCQEVFDRILEESGGFGANPLVGGKDGEASLYGVQGGLAEHHCEGTAVWERLHLEICRQIRTLDDDYQPDFSRKTPEDVRYLLDREGCK